MIRIIRSDVKKNLRDIRTFMLLLFMALVSVLNAVFVVYTQPVKPKYSILELPFVLFYMLFFSICSHIALTSEQLKGEGIIKNRIISGISKGALFLETMLVDIVSAVLLFITAYLPYFLIMFYNYHDDIVKAENAEKNSLSITVIIIILAISIILAVILGLASMLFTGNGGAVVCFSVMLILMAAGSFLFEKLASPEYTYDYAAGFDSVRRHSPYGSSSSTNGIHDSFVCYIHDGRVCAVILDFVH